MTNRIAQHLLDIGTPYVFGFNLGILGVASLAQIETWLKVAVLAATLIMTCLSAWLKWKHRNLDR